MIWLHMYKEVILLENMKERRGNTIDTKKSYFVQLNLEPIQKDHYCSKILQFRNLESFPSDARIIDNKINKKDPVAFVSNYDFSYIGEGSFSYDGKTEKEIEKHARFVTPSLRYVVLNEQNVIVEFDEDAYGKFIYLTKMENGAYFGAE